jgi:hypothetical protein
MKVEKKKVVKKQIWKCELIHYSDGTVTLNRTNDGFMPLELLGLCTKAIHDITDQTKGIINPTTINRKIVKRK